MTEPLVCIIDDKTYIDGNCYQHQVSEALAHRFDVSYVPVSEVDCVRSLEGKVLSRLKLRTLDRTLKSVSAALCDRPLYVYEQDTWESFLVGSPFFGSYKRITESLNVVSFLNTSNWWARQVVESGLPSRTVQMWMNRRLCRPSVRWADRKHDVVFCGTMYPRRQRFFDALERAGTKVEIVRSGLGYNKYLKLVSECKLMIRSERVEWDVELPSGRQTLSDPHALWIRDVECASQGCFSAREHDDEYDRWGLSRLPTVVTFDDVGSAQEVIRSVMSLSDDRADEIVAVSRDVVLNDRGWLTINDALRGDVD